MISGEYMKKLVEVKQTQLDSKTRNILFCGYLEIPTVMDEITLEYLENDKETKVKLVANSDTLSIYREGEMITNLTFQENKKTDGSIESEYGTIPMVIFTHKYIKKENIIVVEYDVLVNDEVVESFRLICTMKEGLA